MTTLLDRLIKGKSSILWPALYERLLAQGMPKDKAATISNAQWNKKKIAKGDSLEGLVDEEATELGLALLEKARERVEKHPGHANQGAHGGDGPSRARAELGATRSGKVRDEAKKIAPVGSKAKRAGISYKVMGHQAVPVAVSYDNAKADKVDVKLQRLDQNVRTSVRVTLDELREMTQVEKSYPTLVDVPAPPQSIMVAIRPPEDVRRRLASAAPSGESPDDLHVTLVFIASGKERAEWPDDNAILQRLQGAVAAMAAAAVPLQAEVSGIGRFNAGPGSDAPVTYASVDAVGLSELRARLTTALDAAEIPFHSEHGFSPHISISYENDPYAQPITFLPDTNWLIQELCVYDGDQVMEFPLLGGHVPLVKSAPEQRYTLGPVYLPLRRDAHGEWTDPDTLQSALWKHVQSGDRTVPDQHRPGTRAGEWVELMTWPFAVTADVALPGQPIRKMEFPANTPFMGIVWDEEPWERVKAGKLRGLSLEGWGRRVTADLVL